MPGIGETLREARMRQKIDISDVEAATKIRAKYLRALENEEFETLQGATFVRSFLRTYARYLGLDAQRLVEQYRARHEPRDEVELQHFTPRSSRGREPLRGAPGPPGRGAAVAALAVALLAFLLVLGLTGGEDDEAERTAGTTAGERSAREQRARERRERERRREDAAGRDERREQPSHVRVRVAPAGATYVCVDRGEDTDVLFEGTIEEPRSFRGRHIRLNLGRTSATVSVDGDEVPIEQGANPVGMSFTPGEREPIPSGQRPCQ